MKFSQLAERQILKAQMEGQLDNLAGSGNPLVVDPAGGAESAGFRIMAEAGVLPREIELRKAVDAQMQSLQSAIGNEDRKREMGKLAELQLRLAIEQEARRKYYSTS